MSYVVDSISAIVASMREVGGWSPNFEHGNLNVIANSLAEKDRQAVKKDRKYPMIALIVPPKGIPEVISDGLYHCKVHIAICGLTKKEYTAEQRYSVVIDPILEPLYKLFLRKLRIAGKFTWSGDQSMPKHTKLVTPHWGAPTDVQNGKYYFNDPVDAIHLMDMEINYRIKCN
jgi:hypothetical protein